jgi:hypothetical protein
MTSYVFIEAFEYKELSWTAKRRVRDWLNNDPIEYEDDEGVMQYDHISEWGDSDIQDHCHMNEYLFNKYGEDIHNLVLTEFKLPSETNEEKQNGI